MVQKSECLCTNLRNAKLTFCHPSSSSSSSQQQRSRDHSVTPATRGVKKFVRKKSFSEALSQQKPKLESVSSGRDGHILLDHSMEHEEGHEEEHEEGHEEGHDDEVFGGTPSTKVRPREKRPRQSWAFCVCVSAV